MASNYPSGLDSFTNPAGTDNLAAGIGHASQHANANDAIEAIEGELGLNPRGGSATVKARFDAIEANSWVTSARIADGTITGTDIASGTVTSTNILDGTILNADVNAAAAIDVSKLSGVMSSATVGNMLTTTQANAEGVSTVYGTTFGGGAATLTISTAQQVQGSSSLLTTATTSAGVYVHNVWGTNDLTVVEGQTYTFSGYVLNSVGARLVRPQITWVNSSNGIISNTTGTYELSATWTRRMVTGVAPAGAVKAVGGFNFTSGTPNAADAFFSDCWSFHRGAGGLWSPPGTPIANLGTYTDESVGRRIFTWDTVNSRWNLTWSDTGWRSISVWDAAGTVTGDALNTGWVPRTGVAGGIFVRRRNDVVSVRIAQLQSNATDPSGNVYTLPAGFRPTNLGTGAVNHYVPVMVYTVGGASATYALNPSSNGAFTAWNVNDWVSGDRILSAECSWMTTDAWPTTNPGSANGTIPYA